MLPSTDASVLAWVKTRATVDEAMRRAAAARTAEPPPSQAAEGSQDVTDVLGRDHQ